MQQLQILGHLGQDAEVKDLEKTQVINFSVATTEYWKDKDGNKQQRTTWFDCAYFTNNVAVAPYLKKGTQVLIQGKPTARAYIASDGTAKAVNGVNVGNITLLGGKPSDAANEDLPF